MGYSKFNSKGDELTRYAFISHMEDYIKKLLTNPKDADIDDYLKSFGFTGPDTLKLLLKRSDPKDENSAIITRKESIKNGGVNDKGEVQKDTFTIKYRVPRKDYTKKMRNTYINLFENYRVENNSLLNEDGEGAAMGGATSADASGQFSQPLASPIRRKIYVTREQAEYLSNMVINEDCPAVIDTKVGDFGYDAPALGISKKDPSMNHKNIMRKSVQEDIRDINGKQYIGSPEDFERMEKGVEMPQYVPARCPFLKNGEDLCKVCFGYDIQHVLASDEYSSQDKVRWIEKCNEINRESEKILGSCMDDIMKVKRFIDNDCNGVVNKGTMRYFFTKKFKPTLDAANKDPEVPAKRKRGEVPKTPYSPSVRYYYLCVVWGLGCYLATGKPWYEFE